MSRPVVLTTRSGRVKAARRLHRRSERTESQTFLAEGFNALAEAVGRDDVVVEVFATPAATEAHPELVDAVRAIDRPWWLVDDVAMGMLSGTVTPPGIVTVCKSVLHPLGEVVRDDQRRPGAARTLVICVDVRDPGNAGAIIRTADAVAARGVVLAGQSVDPFNDKAVRATAGSLFHVPLAVETDIATAIRTVRQAGYRVLATAADGYADLFDAERDGLLDGPVAWLVGNEARGLPEEVGELADAEVSIPIYGKAESLNLSIAVAICLYASARAADGQTAG